VSGFRTGSQNRGLLLRWLAVGVRQDGGSAVNPAVKPTMWSITELRGMGSQLISSWN
jgi:hypothetical protein